MKKRGKGKMQSMQQILVNYDLDDKGPDEIFRLARSTIKSHFTFGKFFRV